MIIVNTVICAFIALELAYIIRLLSRKESPVIIQKTKVVKEDKDSVIAMNEKHDIEALENLEE